MADDRRRQGASVPRKAGPARGLGARRPVRPVRRRRRRERLRRRVDRRGAPPRICNAACGRGPAEQGPAARRTFRPPQCRRRAADAQGGEGGAARSAARTGRRHRNGRPRSSHYAAASRRPGMRRRKAASGCAPAGARAAGSGRRQMAPQRQAGPGAELRRLQAARPSQRMAAQDNRATLPGGRRATARCTRPGT